MAGRRNVLFIIVDQLRADLLDGALAAHVDLPNLRALAARGTSFRRHYSVVNPCGPSRASILTGQYASVHGSINNGTPLRHATPNLARAVRATGRVPMLFGYTDTPGDPFVLDPADPALRTYEAAMPGFDEVVEMRLGQSYPWREMLARAGYDCPDYSRFYEPRGGRLDGPAFYAAEHSDTAFLTDRCLDALAVRRDQDWFALLTYIRPHPPLVAPAPYNRMYDPASLPPPRQGAGPETHPFLARRRDNDTVRAMVDGFPDLEESDETIQTLRAVYLGLATEVDAHIGRLIAFLDETGMADETMIVFCADHGEMLGDYGRWGKADIRDAAYRTPLIVVMPDGTGAGRVVENLTESIDLAPTILEFLGQKAPRSMQGRSLMPLIGGETPPDWRRHAVSELSFGDPVAPTVWQRELGLSAADCRVAIIRDGRYALAHFGGGLPPVLYDHAAEGEARNLAALPAWGGVLLELTQALLSHRLRHTDPTYAACKVTAEGPIWGAH